MSDAESVLPGDFRRTGLFRDPERARQDLERIRVHAPADLFKSVLPLMTDSPDPDQALSLLERFVGQADSETLTLFDRNPVLLHYAIVIFGHSYWLGETLLRNLGLVDSLHRDKNLERSLDREDYRRNLASFRSHASQAGTSELLALFKKREYVRIALRDLLGIATLAETAEEISALSDVIIEDALGEATSHMPQRFSSPRYPAEASFAVVSLGKLGGNELNYSSDVDLFFLHGCKESSEYFIRLAQSLTEILSCATTEGAVFRIDLRLRPQGQEGEPVIGLRPALDYYAHSAQDWELQALIKARHSAGDAGLAREFIRGVQGKVYRKRVNFAAVETALHSREKIGARHRSRVTSSKMPARVDVKLDRGGIRDIEFLVQCLQRVYGGPEPWLRSGGTLFSLQKLYDKGHLGGQDFHELTAAYKFLRTIEHRLQLQRGQQVHRMPASAAEVEVLRRAVSRGLPDELPRAFVFDLQARMDRVAEIYDRVVHCERRAQEQGKGERIEAAASGKATGLRPGSLDQFAQRAAADSPALRDLIARSDLSLHARRSLQRFLSSAMTSSDRYATLLENPSLVQQATALFEVSEYLTDILVRHPNAVRALEQLQRTVEAGARTEDADPSAHVFESGEAMAELRRGFRTKMFVAGARDILSPRPALAAMGDATRAADSAIRSAMSIVEGHDSLAVFALGRLGTYEFDIASDADLLFVRGPEAGADQARGIAERLVHALAAYTREGSTFAVDTRLRPHGVAGELVVTPEQLEKYLAEEAQPWEALTYTKVRFVAGRKDVAALTLPRVWHRIVEMGFQRGFFQQVLEMRARLERSNRYANSFKLARGGFYDIDFIASYLMLRHRSLKDGNSLDRLEHLHQDGLLAQSVFDALKRATLLYRTADHLIRLVTGRARPELPEAEHARQAVEALLNRIVGREDGGDLQAELEKTKRVVRDIFTDVVRA